MESGAMSDRPGEAMTEQLPDSAATTQEELKRAVFELAAAAYAQGHADGVEGRSADRESEISLHEAEDHVVDLFRTPHYPSGEPGVFDLGLRHYVAVYGVAGYRWWHDCPAVDHVSWGWFGNVAPDQVSGHQIVHHVPSLTVEGSLLCTDCGDHGFIRDMRWVPA